MKFGKRVIFRNLATNEELMNEHLQIMRKNKLDKFETEKKQKQADLEVVKKLIEDANQKDTL